MANFIKKHRNIFVIAIVILLVISVAAVKILNNNKSNINETIIKEEISTKEYTLYSFVADNCDACEYMLPIYNAAKEKYSDKISFNYINVTKEYTLTTKYNITIVPTYIIIDKDSKVLKRKIGTMTQEDFYSFIESSMTK